MYFQKYLNIINQMKLYKYIQNLITQNHIMKKIKIFILNIIIII